MKSPKKLSLPSQDEARRFNVLMEKMLSEFRTFGESLSIVRERVDRMEPTLNRVSEDVELLKSIAHSHSKILQEHTGILNKHSAILDEHTGILDEHTGILNKHSAILDEHSTAIRANMEATQAVQADLKIYNRRFELVEARIPS